MLQKAVRKKVQDKSGVFIPSCITLFKNIFFAIDSTDWQGDTQDDQLQLHGTVMDIFQEGEAKIQQQKMESGRSSRLRKKSDQMQLHPPYFVQSQKEEGWIFSYTSNTRAKSTRRSKICSYLGSL